MMMQRPVALQPHSLTADVLVSPEIGSVATEFGLITDGGAVVAPADDEAGPAQTQPAVDPNKLLALAKGVAIILRNILGSSLFFSPKGVQQMVGSVGTSLLNWVLCGVLSMFNALCYAELGTAMPKPIGDYGYIYEAYGRLPAFLYLWSMMTNFGPNTIANMSRTFTSYVFQALLAAGFSEPTIGPQFFAAGTICVLMIIAYNRRFMSKIQNVLMFTNIALLVLTIVIGVVWMALAEGGMDNFEKVFKGTEPDPVKFMIALCFAFWDYFNFMNEEFSDGNKNLPRAIYISLPLVTVIYVLANMAYVAVLTPQAVLSSGAVTFVQQILVAIAAFSGLFMYITNSLRMCFMGASISHMTERLIPEINVNRYTPIPSLVFLGVLSIVYVFINEVYELTTYSNIVESFFIMLSVSAVLYFRYKRPDIHRSVRVPLWVPILFIIICAFPLATQCYRAPYEACIGVAVTLAGISFYYVVVCGITNIHRLVVAGDAVLPENVHDRRGGD